MTEAEENKTRIWYHKNISKKIDFLGDIVPIRGGGGGLTPLPLKKVDFSEKMFICFYVYF